MDSSRSEMNLKFNYSEKLIKYDSLSLLKWEFLFIKKVSLRNLYLVMCNLTHLKRRKYNAKIKVVNIRKIACWIWNRIRIWLRIWIRNQLKSRIPILKNLFKSTKRLKPVIIFYFVIRLVFFMYIELNHFNCT
jgi:hypothetical protein